MTEFEEEARELDADQDNFDRALDHLIDKVSEFKGQGGQDFTNLDPEKWGEMLQVLDFARFIIGGIMYSYGISICGHDHSEDAEDD